MRLIHYSREPLLVVDSTTQEGFRCDKPEGLWVSVNDAWKNWCESEDFALGSLGHETEIILADHPNLLVIDSLETFDSFVRKYGTRKWLGDPCPIWENVAMDYRGIIIAPYRVERRLDSMWYYGWDCASGCIWDAVAIKELRPIKVIETAATSVLYF